MTVAPKEYLSRVRSQYENLPYPFRDVEKERETFYGSEPLALGALSHFGWGGKRDLREGSRFLVAGHGTGDSLAFFAEQLRGYKNAEIFGVDISQTSIDIAKARLAKRGLDNVTFCHASLLDIPKLGIGKFDVIECGGVLHHLEDPDLGLRVLSEALTDDGVLQIMVYGYYGRIAVYQIQEVLKLVAPKDNNDAIRVEQCKALMRSIHKTHWLTQNNTPFLNELRDQSGAGLYDLFLHSQDRAYTIPQLYDWVEQAGLTITELMSRKSGAFAYDPASYLPPSDLLNDFKKLPLKEQHQAAELLHGHLDQHRFCAAKTANRAQLGDDMVPYFGFGYANEPDFLKRVVSAMAVSKLGEKILIQHPEQSGRVPVCLANNALTQDILTLIDGERSVLDIFEALVEKGKLKGKGKKEKQAYMQDLKTVYDELHGHHRIFLRHKSIPSYTTTSEVMHRIQGIKEHPSYQGKDW